MDANGKWAVSEHNPLDIVCGDLEIATCAPTKGLDLKRYEERKANAAHIVACVNGHAALVAAAQDALTLLTDPDADGFRSSEIETELRAAIALAREGKP